MSGERVQVGGVSLFVESLGTGPPLVMLHGFTGSGRTLAGSARDLSGRFRTIRVDLPGHGRSDAPHGKMSYRMERCVAQVAGVIERVADGSAHVLGYSMGGRVALALAALRPDCVRSAVLIGARAGIEAPEERAQRIALDERLAADLESEGLPRFVERWMALPLFASQARLGEDFLSEARRQRLTNRVHGLAGSLRGMGAGAQPPLFDRLGSFSTPTLIVVGEEDARFRPVADDLVRRLPGARVAIVPGAGHAAHLENAPHFRRTVLDFLRTVETARSIEPEPMMEDACRT